MRRPIARAFVSASCLAAGAVAVSTSTSNLGTKPTLIASSSGPVSVTNSPTGPTATVSMPPGMRPGQVVGPNSVTITNASHVDATVALTESNVVNATSGSGSTCGISPATSFKLGDYLQLTIQDTNGTYVFGSASAGLAFDGLTNVALPGDHPHGNWAPNEAHTYRFTVLFPQGPASVVNAYQGRCTSVGFVWTATQVKS